MAQKTFNGTKINVEFEESSSRQQLNSGENISTLFGKIKKIFSDLKAICFSGSYNDLSDKPSALPASGGTADRAGYSDNSDMLDGHHEDYFAKATNPAIEGEIRLLRSGNNTTDGRIFAWEETTRIRNQDPNAESSTYTDLIITPLGIFCEKMSNGSISMGREKILTASDIPTSVDNADKLDGYHADDFAKSSNPSIYGSIRLTGGSSYPSIFPFGDSIRIRNINDETIENHSYADLVITPNGIFRELKKDGVYQGIERILCESDIPTYVEKSNYANSAGDSDKLDGHHESEFARSSYPTINGKITMTGGSTFPYIIVWGDEIIIRNAQLDESATQNTYSQISIKPDGVYVGSVSNGAFLGSYKVLTESESPIHTGEIRGMSEGTSYSINLPFTPVAVMFFDIPYNHHINGGFSLSLWANGFTITPSSSSTMGTLSVHYVAFKG